MVMTMVNERTSVFKCGFIGEFPATSAKSHVHSPMRKQKTTGRTQRCEQNALRQQLADQPKAATAERKADGDFRLTHSRTGKQQIAHIRARYQQHHGDDREQDVQWLGVFEPQPGNPSRTANEHRHATGRCRACGRQSASSLLCSSKIAANAAVVAACA